MGDRKKFRLHTLITPPPPPTSSPLLRASLPAPPIAEEGMVGYNPRLVYDKVDLAKDTVRHI
jgi:hypothetical protein